MTESDLSELHQRALWRSRRGMLELDLLFRPFVEACFAHLTPVTQRAFDELLNKEDVELLALVRRPDQIPDYSTLMQAVLHFRKTGDRDSSLAHLTTIKKRPKDPMADESY